MTTTDQQLVEKALKALGWTRLSKNVASVQSPLWETPAGVKWFEYEANILTSRDACWELWEKDAPEAYWDCVEDIMIDDDVLTMQDDHATAKAICPQRIRALLRWKGVEV